jgi:gas vesicle protein
MAKNNEGIFGAVLAGALIGAAAVFFSDEKNRETVRRKINDMKEKGEEKVEDLREKGLETVSKELDKAHTRVRKMI